ncbi:MAG TPA: prolyl oligopeptidase family serine peptidase [Vicinamibacterales bacterium]|nr:prolyl oligopeptidase family serine peptidase [Vicinamibacterales bacterium]
MRTFCLAAAVSAIFLAPQSRAQSLSPFAAADMLKVATASVLDLSDDGARVAVAVRTLEDNATTDHRRYGDPTYVPPNLVDVVVYDTRTGTSDRVFKQLMTVRRAAWTRDGARLALLTTAENAERLPVTTAWIWDAHRRTLSEVPRQQAIAASSGLEWRPDGSRLVVALRDSADDRAAQAAFKTLVDGPIVVHSSKDAFLEWDALRRAERLRELVALDPRTGDTSALLPKTKLTDYQLARDGSFVTFREDVTEKTDYDVIAGTQNHLKLARGGEVTSLVDARTLKTNNPRWSDDGTLFAFADKGEVFIQGVNDATPRSITPKPDKPAETASSNAAGEKEDEAESFSPGAFSRDNTRLVLTSRKGWYVASVATGTRERVFTLDDKNEDANPRASVLGWTPDGSALLVNYSERSRWDRGVMRLDLQSKQLAPLVRDSNLYQNIRYSHDGSTVVYSMSDGDRPAEVYVADASFGNARKLTALNPWMASKALPRSELVSYRDTDGKVLYGVLRYPVNYQKGQAYPTVFEIYETFFDNGFNARAAFLANHGYAVFHPSVNLVVGRPGESWAKGVTAAANKLIDMGVADPDRLGVHGTSYGGYATVLLLTETDRFKAAINISGKVNMVSFYTDSPRLGVRNTHAPEKSQDRIGGTLWEYPERYLDHSAIMRADRIKTPLLNITGDQDPNVPASQSREIYYALRRLGREVEWVRYADGGHRPPNSVSEAIDFEGRILKWYDKYLKTDSRPATTTQ